MKLVSPLVFQDGTIQATAAAASGSSAPMNYRGAWSSSNSYAINDVITNNSRLYVCKTAVIAGANPVVGTASNGGASSFNVTLPAGTVAGDQVVALLTAFASAPSLQSGWTFIVGAVNTSNLGLSAWTRAITSTDITAGFITFTNPGGQNLAASCVFYHPLGVVLDTVSATALTVVSPSVTPNGTSAVLIEGVGTQSGTSTATQSSLTSIAVGHSSATTVAVGYEAVGSGASSARTWTLGTSNTPVACTVALLTSAFPATSFTELAVNDDSLVTAKGDLVVATAAGNVTNLPVGANGLVLTSDSTQADGVKWAPAPNTGWPIFKPKSTSYINPVIFGAMALSGQTVTTGSVYALPFLLPACTIVQAGCYNVGTAQTGSSMRLALVSADINGLPDATKTPTDFGTVSTATTGEQNITGLTVSITTPGLYWLLMAIQGSPATPVKMFGWGAAQSPFVQTPNAGGGGIAQQGAYFSATAINSGALTAWAGSNATVEQIPLLTMKVT